MLETDESVLRARFEQAYAQHYKMMGTFARNCVHQLPDMDIDDIRQELSMMLWKCVKNYDPDRGASFNTLFQGSARNLVISLVRASDVQKRGKGKITQLDDEAFTRAAENMRADGSAEDWYLALSELGQKFAAELRRSEMQAA